MLIKSGEGVVYLTRPQKYFQSSPHIHKKQIFHSKQKQQSEAPRHYCPSPTKIEANSPNMAPFFQNTAAQQVPRLIQANNPKISVKKTWHLRPKLL